MPKLPGVSHLKAVRALGEADVVLVDDLPINDMIQLPIPSALGAVEVYRGTAGAPPNHRSPCGTIIFWTRR